MIFFSLGRESPPFQSIAVADEDAESPKSKHVAGDTTLRGSENITPQGKASFPLTLPPFYPFQ